MAFGKSATLDDGGNMLENPRIFTYIIGGMSHHEICSIAEL